jgi:hypothetical protein
VRRRLPTLLVAAWLFAVIAGGNVLLVDRHFVMRGEIRRLKTRRATTFRSFGVVEVFASDELARWLAEPSSVNETTDVLTYPEARARIGGGSPDADRAREILVRLSHAGAALFWLVCGAPVLGLLALLWGGASPALRHVLLLLGALLPLAALEYFGAEVDAYRASALANPGPVVDDLVVTVHATFATWAARAAWGLLAVAAAVSWWRWPKRQVTPVDPGVFE